MSATDNVDTIRDFTRKAGNTDQIALSGATFGDLAAGPLAAALFAANESGVATEAEHRIVYNTASGDLSYDQDGDGAAEAVLFARIGQSSHPKLMATDFVVI